MDNAHTAVTQEDKDAANDFRMVAIKRMMAGEPGGWKGTPDDLLAQAFARHRVATTADLQARLDASEARVAELVGALGLAIAYLSDLPHEPAVKITNAFVNGRQALTTTRNADAQSEAIEAGGCAPPIIAAVRKP